MTVALLTTQSAWAEGVRINKLLFNATPNFSTSTSVSKSIRNNAKETFHINKHSDLNPVIASVIATVRTGTAPIIKDLQSHDSKKNELIVRKTSSQYENKVSKLISKSFAPGHLLVYMPPVNINTQQRHLLLGQRKIQNRVFTQAERSTLFGQKLPSQESKAYKLDSSDHKLAKIKLVEVNTIEQPAAITSPQIHNYLNPNPNLLQFPTKLEEVKVRGVQPITLEEALELARRNNRDLQLALLRLKRFKGALLEAKSALYPSLGIQTQINRQQSSGNQLNDKLQSRAEKNLPPQSAIPSRDPINTNFQGQAQLTYNFYTSGGRSSAIKIADYQVKSIKLDIERISEEIRLNVASEYYNLQQMDENVRIAQSAVKNAQASLKDAKALEQAGVGTRFEVLRSQVNLANTKQNLISAMSKQKIARNSMGNRLGIAQTVIIVAADEVKLAGLWNMSLEESIIKAFTNRPELRQNLIQRNINKQKKKQALSVLRPKISLIANYDLLDQFDDGIGITDGYSVGLQATMTLFDGGKSKAQASQAETNMAIAETQFAQQRNQIRFEVEQAHSNLKSNLENLKTANTALDQAKEALRLARLRFQAGVGTQTDVIAAESDLTRSEGNRVRAILDYNRSLINLQRFVIYR
ncbi:MAG TPA: TolC family protein [Richelia sp.]|nr:TolC family protein [Richelia sp.]